MSGFRSFSTLCIQIQEVLVFVRLQIARNVLQSLRAFRSELHRKRGQFLNTVSHVTVLSLKSLSLTFLEMKPVLLDTNLGRRLAISLSADVDNIVAHSDAICLWLPYNLVPRERGWPPWYVVFLCASTVSAFSFQISANWPV